MSTLSTIKQIGEKHPAFPESSTRWIVFNAANPKSKYAKFAKAIHWVGGRVLIDEPNLLSADPAEMHDLQCGAVFEAEEDASCAYPNESQNMPGISMLGV